MATIRRCRARWELARTARTANYAFVLGLGLACSAPDPGPPAPRATGGTTAGTTASGGTAGTAGAAGATPNTPPAPRHPFGAQPPAPELVLPSAPDVTAAAAAVYDAWKAEYLVEGCGGPDRYLVRTAIEPGNLALSEGQGYGMILSAYFAGHDPDAQRHFDGLFRLALARPADCSPALMAWYLNDACEPVRAGARDAVTASDADLDLAYALLLADAQWGSCGAIDYRARALETLAAIARFDLEPTQRSVRLGDWANTEPWSRVLRTSDVMPGHFTAFAAAHPDGPWATVRTTLHAALLEAQRHHAPATGLVPDYLLDPTTAPTPALGAPFTADEGTYSWNASRVPWRLGVAALAGDTDARAELLPLLAFFRHTTGDAPMALGSGYALDGALLEPAASAAFRTPLGIPARLDPTNRPWLDAIFESSRVLADDYFAATIQVLALVALSSNWWVPLDNPQPCPEP